MSAELKETLKGKILYEVEATEHDATAQLLAIRKSASERLLQQR
jgi:hypothetical protein